MTRRCTATPGPWWPSGASSRPGTRPGPEPVLADRLRAAAGAGAGRAGGARADPAAGEAASEGPGAAGPHPLALEGAVPNPGGDPAAEDSALAAPVAHPGGVVELGRLPWAGAGADGVALRLSLGSKRSRAGWARCLQNPFPGMGARAIINAVYGFFQSFPPESWRVRPRPGPTARDRAPLSRRWFQRGQAPTRCVTRYAGVEFCSSGVHVDAGYHTMLAPVVSRAVSVANIVQEVKTGTDTAAQDPNLRSNSQSAHDFRAHPSRCGWNELRLRPLPHVRRRCSQTVASRHSHSPPAMPHRQAGGISLLRRHG